MRKYIAKSFKSGSSDIRLYIYYIEEITPEKVLVDGFFFKINPMLALKFTQFVVNKSHLANWRQCEDFI